MLLRLDREIRNRVLAGESALRIALSNDLLLQDETWDAVLQAIRQEVERQMRARYVDRPLLRALSSYPYVAKVLWFREAFDAREFQGDNHQAAFATALGVSLQDGTNRDQLRRFGENPPFEFIGPDGFRQHVWCLRFAQGDGEENGFSSYIARALRKVHDLTEDEALDPESPGYHTWQGEPDVCAHLCAILMEQGAPCNDYRTFIHEAKNWVPGAEHPSWLEELYNAYRRLIVGLRRSEARDAGRPDTLPEVGLDAAGNVVLLRPDLTSFDEATYTNGDKFLFYRPHEHTPVVSWNYIDGVFDGNGCESIRLDRLDRVELQRQGEEVRVTGLLKYFLSDVASGVTLYRVHGRENSPCGYSLSQNVPLEHTDLRPAKLVEGEYYKLVSRAAHKVIAYSADAPEGIELPLSEFSSVQAETGVFRVPLGTLEIDVCGLRLPIRDVRVNQLVHGRGRIDCVCNATGRFVHYPFVYNRTTYPLQDVHGVSEVWYEWDGSRRQIPVLPAPGRWAVDTECLWRRGRLNVSFSDGSQRMFPVAFVDVDFSSLRNHPLPIGDAGQATVRLGGTERLIDIGGADAEVRVDHLGFHFRPQVCRVGVQIALRDRSLSVAEGDRSSLDVSVDDLADPDAVLRVRSEDPDGLYFSCGEFRVDISDYVRNNQPIPFSRLLDVRGLVLPAKCTVAYPAGYRPFVFTVYDTKSAVIQAEGADERRVIVEPDAASNKLTLSYFTSFRLHGAGSKLELAVLPAHRQDQQPHFIELNNRKLDDDPGGLHRCVEKAEVKDFYAQDIDWGYGVIGFVVERGTYRVESVTTGFFIPAQNPTAPNLEGDILAELRTALAERQVRRGVRMTEEDADRLRRIAAEFMAEDETKREAVRKYICDAAEVASQLNALDSINSFCNRIKTAQGKVAWVGGYAFMAGWFVRDFVVNGAFRDWPFPQPYWHPSLIAYQYQAPARNELLAAEEAGLMWYVIYTRMEELSSDIQGRYSYMLEEIRALIEKLRFARCVPNDLNGMGAFIPNVRNAARCVYQINTLMHPEREFSYYQMFSVFRFLGKLLYRWRSTPSLNESLSNSRNVSVQDLKEYLLFVDELDELLDAENRFCSRLIQSYANQRYFYNLEREANNGTV